MPNLVSARSSLEMCLHFLCFILLQETHSGQAHDTLVGHLFTSKKWHPACSNGLLGALGRVTRRHTVAACVSVSSLGRLLRRSLSIWPLRYEAAHSHTAHLSLTCSLDVSTFTTQRHAVELKGEFHVISRLNVIPTTGGKKLLGLLRGGQLTGLFPVIELVVISSSGLDFPLLQGCNSRGSSLSINLGTNKVVVTLKCQRNLNIFTYLEVKL